MKFRHVVSCMVLSVIALFLAGGALQAQDQQDQDVAAAARANRANRGDSMSISAGSEQQAVDALRICLADNTSGRDRKDLAKWVFFAMAAHPEMKQYVAAGSTAADDSSKTMAALVTRLLTDSCSSQVKAAMKIGEGSQAVKLAFQALGQLAMQELMADKNVQEAMAAFGQYVDQSRLKTALAEK